MTPFALLSLRNGTKSPSSAIHSIGCGFFSLLAFLTYNGYWPIAGFAILTHVICPPREIRRLLARGFLSSLTFLLGFFLISSALPIKGGHFFQGLLGFSRTVTQGVFSEGWSLPFAYLWFAEHTLLFLWAIALGFAIVSSRWHQPNRARTIAIAGVVVIYGSLVLTSVFLSKFVVYGRLAKPLVPFFCLLTALFLEWLFLRSSYARRLAKGIIGLTCLQAAMNFYEPLSQVFPKDFHQQAAARILRDSRRIDPSRYRMLFVSHIYPVPLTVFQPSGTVLMQARHPLQYAPYQFEGYTPSDRHRLRTLDFSMRLVLSDKP